MEKGSDKKYKILFVDDDPIILETIKLFFKNEPEYMVILRDSAEKGMQVIREIEPDLIFSDLKMPNTDGIEFLEQVKKLNPATPFIILSGLQDISLVVEAMKKGAQDYLSKPIAKELIVHSIRKTLTETSMKEEIRLLKEQVEDRFSFENFVGSSPEIQGIYDKIRILSDTDATVLILGETGTGKELVANAIHQRSIRKDKPFIKINCAAISETLLESELFGHEKGAFTGAIKTKRGKFELGDGGTISLDEIGDISLRMQSKLLRVLQEREFERVGGIETISVDVRIIASTNADLQKGMENGTFRSDLYYRLNVFPIHLPPLRTRIQDVPLLSEHFMKLYNNRFNRSVKYISRDVLDYLMNYHWPGNVRELENVIEKAVIVCRTDIIELKDIDIFHGFQNKTPLACPLPDKTGNYQLPDLSMPYTDAKNQLIEELETNYLIKYLDDTRGSIQETSRLMGLSPRSVYEKMKRYRIDKFKFKQ